MTGEKQGLFSHFFADLYFLYTIVYNKPVRNIPEQRTEKQRKKRNDCYILEQQQDGR